LDGGWKERVFVWRLESSDERIEFLSLTQCPVEEAEVAVWYLEGAWLVDGTVQRELNLFGVSSTSRNDWQYSEPLSMR
jgi:hypothetical protein